MSILYTDACSKLISSERKPSMFKFRKAERLCSKKTNRTAL